VHLLLGSEPMIKLAVALDEGAWADPVAIARQCLELMFGPVRMVTDKIATSIRAGRP
jgi:hypothetical protein